MMRSPMQEYECRACGRYMFSTDAPFGRLRVICPDRRCSVSQIVYLGGPQNAHDMAAAVERFLQDLRTELSVR